MAGRGLQESDAHGITVISKLNCKRTKVACQPERGQYFEINEGRNDVARLISTISKIEGELRDARFVDVSANRYYLFLVVALVLLALGCIN